MIKNALIDTLRFDKFFGTEDFGRREMQEHSASGPYFVFFLNNKKVYTPDFYFLSQFKDA